MTRRDFLKASTLSGSALLAGGSAATASAQSSDARPALQAAAMPPSSWPRLPDLSPARWIWYPSGRTLPNTFLLFRRELELATKPRRAVGWIAAESRYRLEVNGERIQFGPSPSDPRWAEADPIDLTEALQPGKNVLGTTVLFYGCGDGTWPIGKPGFLLFLEIEHADGRKEKIVSDAGWKVHLCRAWTPGHYKRWYLRALQEEFDARRYPYGWSTVEFAADANWLSAMPLNGSPNRPALSAEYYEYMLDLGGGPADAELRPRRIAQMRESLVPVAKLSESLWLEWQRSPQEYFEVRTPDAFKVHQAPVATDTVAGQWEIKPNGNLGAVLTFEMAEQVVGWPFFTIEAPAGTTIELLVQEAHRLGGPALLNTHFDSWTRFTCREGVNRFETFDFESLRWLQLHIHNFSGPATIRDIGVRRRMQPWPNEPKIRTKDLAIQKVFDASINTLNNCAQETLVDGMARERQQYSGDGGHQMHAVHLVFGEPRLSERYVTTFSQGLTKDGFFLDCWPAFDRLARLMERQLDLSGWGPILDHGIGFIGDCWHHYNYSGDRDALIEPYPRLVRFARYLKSIVGTDGLLPVENIGIPSVWIDHVAYQQQRHKQCAFNLYAIAMLNSALGPMARLFNDDRCAEAVESFANELHDAVVKKFWDSGRGLFVVNRPWIAEEKNPRLCDRSLATAVLYDLFPSDQSDAAVRALAECPPEMGYSYPANAIWRWWALAKAGRADVIVQDLRQKWAAMNSVKLNNTLQEDWNAEPDSGSQWSHCPVGPLIIAVHGLAGIRPLAPGFRRVEIRPQPAQLESLEVTAHTLAGPIKVVTEGGTGDRQIDVTVPSNCEGELILPSDEKLSLERTAGAAPKGCSRYKLQSGEKVRLRLKVI